ncbi:MAG: hypothetical protein VCD00_13460, partial [Candidatus Hydrogenedentota bacterium]
KNRHTKVVHVHHYSLRERLGRFYQNNRGIVNVSVLSVATLSIIIVASGIDFRIRISIRQY